MTSGETQPRRTHRSSFSRFVFGLGLLVAVVGGAVAAEAPTATGDPPGPPVVGPEAPATAMDLGVGLAQNSPKLLVDPTQPRFVVLANRVDAPDFGCELQVSGDGGTGWVSADPVPELPPGAEKCYAPEVAFDRDGVLYYLFVGLAGPGNEPIGVFLTTSADRAQTFTTPHQVLGPLNFAARMAIDPTLGENGRIHVTWIHATSDPPLGAFGPPPNPIMAAYSDDGGRSFSPPVQVSESDRLRVVAPALAIGSDHTVHVAYYDLEDDARDYQGLEGPVWEGTWSLVLASSFDGGERFQRTAIVDAEVRPHERVMLVFTMPPPALVSAGGRVCMAWADARHGDADILGRCSNDEGESWEELQRLNDDALANGRTQYLPQLSIGPDGLLHVIFYDRRNDSEDILQDVYYAHATGDGSFIPNVRVTSHASSSRIGQQYVHPSAAGQFELGSRLSLLASPSKVLAAWPDTRNSRMGTTGQSLFTAELDLPRSGTGETARRRQVGAVILAAGLTTAAVALAGRRHWERKLLGAIRRHKASLGSNRPASGPSRIAKALGSAAFVAVLVGFALRLPRTPPPLPPSPPVVVVGMHEYSFDFEPAIPSGRVVFRFQNEGRFNHRPILVPLSEDVPPIAEQIRGTERRASRPFAGVGTLEPGEQGTFAVDLVAGQRYGIVDFEQGPDEVVHALKGMAAEFRAFGPAASVPTTGDERPTSTLVDDHHGERDLPPTPLTVPPAEQRPGS